MVVTNFRSYLSRSTQWVASPSLVPGDFTGADAILLGPEKGNERRLGRRRWDGAACAAPPETSRGLRIQWGREFRGAGDYEEGQSTVAVNAWWAAAAAATFDWSFSEAWARVS